MKRWETSLDATGLNLAVVVARFNHLICAKLLEGALEELGRRGRIPTRFMWPGCRERSKFHRRRARSRTPGVTTR